MAKPEIKDDLTETLEQMLVPVRPPAEFRDHLRNNLKLAGHQQATRRLYRKRRMSWQNWWLAVVLFTTSIAAGSVLAYLLRSRLLSTHSL